MNFIVIGLGSMGKRRIRLLQNYINSTGNSSWRVCGIDKRKDRRREVEEEYGICTEESIEDALKGFEAGAAFVCTSPLSHSDVITECLCRNLHVFTEINLVDDRYDRIIALAEEKSCVLYLSSTFLHRREIKYIKNWVREKNYKLAYRYHVGQYLPEWHPWENYKDFFVSDKRTNGCRELFAIELPWLIDSFGTITCYKSTHTKLSQLEIDYDDTYHVMICHSTGITGFLDVDIVSPRAERHLEIFGEKKLLVWDGTPDSLHVLNITNKLDPVDLYEEAIHQNGYERFIIEDAYLEEIKEFVRCIVYGVRPSYSFENDKSVLGIIDGIEA